MLSILHTLLHLIPTTLCGVGTIIFFFLQLRTQRHREVIQVIQSHTAGKLQNQDLNPDSLAPEPAHNQYSILLRLQTNS